MINSSEKIIDKETALTDTKLIKIINEYRGAVTKLNGLENVLEQRVDYIINIITNMFGFDKCKWKYRDHDDSGNSIISLDSLMSQEEFVLYDLVFNVDKEELIDHMYNYWYTFPYDFLFMTDEEIIENIRKEIGTKQLTEKIAKLH